MRPLAFLALVLAAIGGALLLPPIAQDQEYHHFADHRPLAGVPNALDVLSNLPFAVVGSLGLLFVVRRGAPRPEGPIRERWERWALAALFAGVFLTAFGSAYYHLAPSDARLFWDRLPMTLGFVSLFSLVIGERVASRWGAALLGPLLVAGAASVVHWRLSGDLRFYGLVQFLPLAALPLLLLWFPPAYTRAGDLWAVLGWYVGAKLLEWWDRPVFELGGLVSGHTLKHLAAAAAALWILRMAMARRAANAR